MDHLCQFRATCRGDGWLDDRVGEEDGGIPIAVITDSVLLHSEPAVRAIHRPRRCSPAGTSRCGYGSALPQGRAALTQGDLRTADPELAFRQSSRDLWIETMLVADSTMTRAAALDVT